MINLENIKAQAYKINGNGLDKEILKEADKIFNVSEEKAKSFFPNANYGTHVTPKTIAFYMQLFGGNLEGLKTLDLGCGLGRYSPVLPFAFKELGAKVNAVDIYDKLHAEGLIKNGINYEKVNLNQHYFFEEYGDLFKGNDIVVARSLLDGGFYEDEDRSPILNAEEELNNYKLMINKARLLNGQEALYELDKPGDIISKRRIGYDSEKNFVEEEFNGEIITGFYEGESGYPKPFFIF